MDIINLNKILTAGEKKIVAGIFEMWCNQSIDADSYPVIGIAMRKGSDGQGVMILKAEEYTNDQLKQMLTQLALAL